MLNQTEIELLKALRDNPFCQATKNALKDCLEENGHGEINLDETKEGHELNTIVGKTISKVFACNYSVLFKTQERFEGFVTEESCPCCLVYWIFRVDNPENLIGEEVLGVFDANTDDIDPEDGLCRRTEEWINGINILTKKGICRIVCRESLTGTGYGSGYLTPFKEDSIPHYAVEIKESWVNNEKV